MAIWLVLLAWTFPHLLHTMLLTTPNDSMLGNKSTRGALIVLEGVDRCGKTTQTQRLCERLKSQGQRVHLQRFPDRTTATGQLINIYLKSSDHDLDDHAIHLLFSANRWEVARHLLTLLGQGVHVVCDRYAYSGVAFSAAKVTRRDDGTTQHVLDFDWCRAPDVGLPAPDCVCFLDVDQAVAEQRGGFGGERYETTDMQIRVRQKFTQLQQQNADDSGNNSVPWKVIDAAQSMDDVQHDINDMVDKVLQHVQSGRAPLRKLWIDGVYDLEHLEAVVAEDKENSTPAATTTK